MTYFGISDNGTQVLVYSGSLVVSSSTLPGATSEIPGVTPRAFACRYVAWFQGQYYTFQSNGVWVSRNRTDWAFSYAPPGLVASNPARAGFLVLTLNGTQYLCAAYNITGNNWALIKSLDGVSWEVSPTFTLQTSDIARMLAYNNQGYCFNSSGSALYIRRFDWGNMLIYEALVRSSVAVPTADMFVVTGSLDMDDGIYISVKKTVSPRGLMLLYISPDSTYPVIVTPSVDSNIIDDAAYGSAYYFPRFDTIYVITKLAGTGLGGFRSNAFLTGFDNVTSSLIPTGLQTNAQTTRIQTVPGSVDNGLWNIRYDAANLYNTFNLELEAYFERLEPLSLSGTGGYFPVIQGESASITAYLDDSESVINPGIDVGAFVVSSTTTTGSNQITIDYTFFNNFGITQIQISVFYKTNNNQTYIPATITSSFGTVSGNTLSAPVSPGYNNISLSWLILVDSPALQQSYELSTQVHYNTPQAREATTSQIRIPYTF